MNSSSEINEIRINIQIVWHTETYSQDNYAHNVITHL